ncbi:MAG: DUF5615 family PIN-like protein [Crocinitomicaceae bacterium]
MKLLFDQHFSFRTVQNLLEHFPNSHHLKYYELEGESDDSIWYFAKKHDYTIVTKDNDFNQRSLVFGHPPKVIWVILPNTKRTIVEKFLVQKLEEIVLFHERDESLLILRKGEQVDRHQQI